ncbi:MAG: hypothetical protein OHK0029_01330 [Armatimonadaceae bacterium]
MPQQEPLVTPEYKEPAISERETLPWAAVAQAAQEDTELLSELARLERLLNGPSSLLDASGDSFLELFSPTEEPDPETAPSEPRSSVVEPDFTLDFVGRNAPVVEPPMETLVEMPAEAFHQAEPVATAPVVAADTAELEQQILKKSKGRSSRAAKPRAAEASEAPEAEKAVVSAAPEAVTEELTAAEPAPKKRGGRKKKAAPEVEQTTVSPESVSTEVVSTEVVSTEVVSTEVVSPVAESPEPAPAPPVVVAQTVEPAVVPMAEPMPEPKPVQPVAKREDEDILLPRRDDTDVPQAVLESLDAFAEEDFTLPFPASTNLPPKEMPEYPTMRESIAAAKARRENRAIRFLTPHGILMLADPVRGVSLVRTA